MRTGQENGEILKSPCDGEAVRDLQHDRKGVYCQS
jgi:hypothetical protein